MDKKKVLVIGSGVSGLSTAKRLLESGYAVTIWSKEAPGEFPHTSLNAYAMWVPVRVDSDPRIEKWTNGTLQALNALAEVKESGVVLRPIFQLKTAACEPWFAGSYAHFRHAKPNELTADYMDAHVLEKAPVVDPTTYLPWLRRQVELLGGTFQQREVTELARLPADFSVVVNASGLGSRQLTADKTLYAERVQVLTLKNRGFDRVVIDDEGPNKRACIVPHANHIKLGAIFDSSGESTEADEDMIEEIMARCNRMAPDLGASPCDLLSATRALRPERPLPRVEKNLSEDGRLLIHNYGHDGMGYLLSWGIADDIVDNLLKD